NRYAPPAKVASFQHAAARFRRAAAGATLLALATLAAPPLASGDEQDPFDLPNPTGGARPSAAEQTTEDRFAPPPPRPPAAASVQQPVFWADGKGDVRRRIDQTLDRPLTASGLDFTDTRLDEIIEFVRAEYGLEIVIDILALEDLGIGVDEPMTVNLQGVTLREGLALLLKQLELEAIYLHGCLVITTNETAALELSVAVYPVGDLLNRGLSLPGLAGLLSTVVSPDAWQRRGGEGQIEPLAPGLLVVTQSYRVHRELLAALNAIRTANQTPEADPGVSDWGGCTQP
ncbi:MAG: hypothetical protein AAF790_03575, partial [Planctomycetota bacterium]